MLSARQREKLRAYDDIDYEPQPGPSPRLSVGNKLV
jgi:hypothetical protein